MEADQQVPAAAAGGNDVRPLPYESVVARAVFQRNRKSVVRLRIAFIGTDKDGNDRFGCGTGFIVLSNARHMVIMSCSHSFANWDRDTYVQVMFHGGDHALADVALLRKEKELALLVVNFSASRGSSFSNAEGRHPQVVLAHADARKGDLLVMLGYPTSSPGSPELGTFHGSVTNDTTTIKGLQLLSADYPAAPGASGSPVFGVYGGDDHRVVGLCKGGRRGVAYTVPVSCIRDTLKTAQGATGWPENATILEMLQLWVASMVPAAAAAAAAGDPGEGQPGPRQGPPGSGAAGPSSSEPKGTDRAVKDRRSEEEYYYESTILGVDNQAHLSIYIDLYMTDDANF